MSHKFKWLLLSAIPFFFLTAKASGQDTKLIEAAKKEGKVVAYGSLENDTVTPSARPSKRRPG